MDFTLCYHSADGYELHKTGCRDLEKFDSFREDGFHIRGDSPKDALASFFTDEGTEGNIGETRVMPCCKVQ